MGQGSGDCLRLKLQTKESEKMQTVGVVARKSPLVYNLFQALATALATTFSCSQFCLSNDVELRCSKPKYFFGMRMQEHSSIEGFLSLPEAGIMLRK